MFPLILNLTEVRSHFHVATGFARRKELSAPTEKESVWASEPVRTLWSRETRGNDVAVAVVMVGKPLERCALLVAYLTVPESG